MRIEALRGLLAREQAPSHQYVGATCMHDDGTETSYFDPWEIFPAVYGSYSSDFDDAALAVLTGLMTPGWWPQSLAHEMLQEMLCTAKLCDYGTSPRGCFATADFKELLPSLIEKWRGYYAVIWGYAAKPTPPTEPGPHNRHTSR